MTRKRPISDSQLRHLIDLCGGVALLMLLAVAIEGGFIERTAHNVALLQGQSLVAATAYGTANFALPNYGGFLDQINCYAGVTDGSGASYNSNTGLPPCAVYYGAKSGGPVAELTVRKTSGTLGRTAVLSFPTNVTNYGTNQMGVPVGTSLTLEWSCQPTKHYVYTYCTQRICAPWPFNGNCWCNNSAESQQYNYFYQNGSNAAGQYPIGSTAGALQGSRTVTFTGETTYTLSCSGFAGTGQLSIPVVVAADTTPTPGTIAITGNGSNPTEIMLGESVTVQANFMPGTAMQGQTFSATAGGSDQTFTAPPGVTSVFVKLWGAAGGGYGSAGGGGGYTEGTVSVSPGTPYKVVVGKGGRNNSGVATYGGGGQATAAYNASGGGRSAFCGSNGGAMGACASPELELLTAGGGGGAYSQSWRAYGAGGAGGGGVGQDGISVNPGARGTGGTQTSGGFYAQNGGGLGGQFYGGAMTPYGGGGGGWYGGGAGMGSGGGSGHCGSDALNCISMTGSGATPANGSDPDRPSGVGVGTGGVSGDGFVKVSYGGPETLLKTAINLEGTLWCGTGCTPNDSMSSVSLPTKSYTFTPTAVGTYTFVPSMQTSGFPSWNNYDASLIVTVRSMDFTLSVTSLASNDTFANTASAVLADAGLLVRKRITATFVSGTPEAVTFSASGLPPGASANFSSTSCTPTCSTDLSIVVPTSVVTPGTYMIMVTAIGGGTTRTTTFPIVVGGASCTGPHEVPPLCSTCESGYSMQNGSCVPDAPTISLTVAPSFIRPGGSATATWSASGLLPESTCTISSTPADKVSAGLPADHGATWSGAATIPNVTGTVIVRMVCNGGAQKSASVRLLPDYIER